MLISCSHNFFRLFSIVLGTLSNLDDEPSGRRAEVFSRSRQLLRMSVCRPHGVQDVTSVDLPSSGERVHLNQSFTFLCPFYLV